MIRKFYSASVLLLMLIIISSCGKVIETSKKTTDHTNTSLSSETEASDPEASATSLSADTVDMQDDNTKIHASVIIPDVCKEGSAFTAVGSALDLVSDIEALQSDFVPSAVETVIEINPDNPGLFSIMSQDENSWTALGYNDSGDFVLNSALFGLYRNCIVTTPGIDEHNADLYQNKPDLNFMTLNDAVKEAQTVLSRYDICLGDVVNAYTMDYQTMLQELDVTDAMGKNDPELQNYNWTDADDAYYFFFHQSYNGIPMMNIRCE